MGASVGEENAVLCQMVDRWAYVERVPARKQMGKRQTVDRKEYHASDFWLSQDASPRPTCRKTLSTKGMREASTRLVNHK